MSPALPQGPYAQFKFRLEVDGGVIGGFSELTGLQSRITAPSLREGAHDASGARRSVEELTIRGVTLKRGVADGPRLEAWIESTRSDPPVDARRTARLTLIDTKNSVRVATWTLRDTLPTNCKSPSLGGDDEQVAIEELVLAVGSIELDASPGL